MAYQGIGKSTLGGRNGCIDLESSNFYVNGERQENWHEIYGNIALSLSKQGYVVLAPTHAALREYLHRHQGNEIVCVCYPALSLKNDWIKKLEERCEANPTKKNIRAMQNARERYSENINEIKSDAESFNWNVIEIKDFRYSLELEIDSLKSKLGKLS